MCSHMTVTIYTDGGARNNPGPAGAGAVIYSGSQKVGEVKKFLGSQTNNWAEYEAVALALSEAARLGLSGQSLEMRMDSKLVVEQVLGRWKIKEPTLRPQVEKVRALLHELFPTHHLTHVPREENVEADALVNEAIDEGLGIL